MRKNYKFILKVTLLKQKNGLTVEFLKWDPNFVYNKEKNEYPYYEDKNHFFLYSFGQGDMYDDTFTVPDVDNLKKGSTLYTEFLTEEDRYKYVKSLYSCMKEFGDAHYKQEGKESRLRIRARIWGYR